MLGSAKLEGVYERTRLVYRVRLARICPLASTLIAKLSWLIRRSLAQQAARLAAQTATGMLVPPIAGHFGHSGHQIGKLLL
jgi:hypothetical protein